ncbi:neuronal acetylcholine receptor subunit alpha-10-like [Amphiura filiformis]|uniref:neuronal acetylcholine receptor subunit alpha-10-like n=1 Tax=Amphiura filiformis TaxID=82378 RepID=UPI003B20E531
MKTISSILKWAFLVWAHFKDCEGSYHKQLRDHLIQNYGNVVIRPVKDTSTLTKVTVRPLFNNLVEMNMKSQYFIMDCWLKLIWTDEFLIWDPANYNGTGHIYLPSDLVWKPDITFYENVDLFFQRFKPDTVVNITSTGQITWLVPIFLVSGCPIRVMWFPYDIQVCDMTFGSFGYTGKELELIPESGEDANQNRYLANGVWDMVAVDMKPMTTYFSCCEFPFYEVQYRLIFKRQPDFYLLNLIIPVSLISVLSLMAFYLPPECGEKVTLSVTNLLALVVFQQIISDNMPPNGSESPIIGSYFFSMIATVSASVIATVIVIHMSSIAHKPIPSWVHWIVLQILPRLVCMNAIKTSQRHHETKSAKRETATISSTHYLHNLIAPVVHMSTFADEDINDGSKLQSKSFDVQIEEENQNRHDWKLVSLVVDRYMMLIFSITTVVITVTLLVTITIGSKQEFEYEIDFLNNTWKLSTERWL